jgi:5-methylcytosine-specific restriction protein A
MNKNAAIESTKEKKGEEQMIAAVRPRERRWNGKLLNELWEVHARHALYHKDGTFFENLRDFPGALFDDNGYVIFRTEQEYKNCSYLDIGQKLNVYHGISSIPGYKRMEVE